MGFYSGVFNTTVNPAELNKRSFASTLLRLFPDGVAPIFALTSQTGKSSAKSSTHGYFIKIMSFAKCKINNGAGYNAAATTFTIDAQTEIFSDMVLYNTRTKENYRVTNVGSTTSITVTRAFGRVAAAALLDDDDIICVGTAFAEGSARPAARGMTTTYIPNYTQIFRNAWALTDTARASLTEMGFTNIAENRQDGGMLHSSEIEAAILFGQPKMDTSGTQPVHATQGIIDATEQYALANIYTEGGGSTQYAELITAFAPAWTYSHSLGDTKTRMCFAGSTAMKVFNDIARLSGVVQIQQGQTSFGMSYQKFMFYKGTVILMEHPILNGLQNMSKLAVTVDMPAVKLAYMNGRDTKPEEYGGDGRNNAGGIDAVGGSYTTELAVEDLNPYGNAILYGLTVGAA